MGAFGEKLRKQREQRGIALDAISNSTKISTRMLRALEEEKFDQLPGGVFNKGFVRAYARQVGLDEDEAISAYLEALRETQVQSQQILPNFRASRADTAPSTHGRGNQNHEPSPSTGRPHEAAGSSSLTHPLAESGHSMSATPPSTELSAKEKDALVEERRKLERRADERRQAERRNESSALSTRTGLDRSGQVGIEKDPSKEDQTGQDWIEQNRSGNQPAIAWQVEDRRAADLLSQVHAGEGENDRRFAPAAPLFSSGTYGESPAGLSYNTWGKVAVVLLLVFLLLGFWRVRHRNSLRSIAQAASPTIPVTEPQPFAASTSAQGRSAPPITKTALKSNGVESSPIRASNRSSNLSSESAESGHSAVPLHSAAHAPLSPKTPAPFTLLIRAEKTAWISVSADGKPVAQETLIAPAETTIRASNEIVVRTGNAAGISFILNSRNIPAQGNDGEVKTYTFDESGLRAAVSQPSN